MQQVRVYVCSILQLLLFVGKRLLTACPIYLAPMVRSGSHFFARYLERNKGVLRQYI